MRRVKIADLKNRLSNVLRTLLTMVVAGVLALTAAGSAQADIESERFRLPSGNISCGFAGAYVDALGRVNPPSLRCDILAGLKPRPSRLARPASCDLDWGDSGTLLPTGRTELLATATRCSTRGPRFFPTAQPGPEARSRAPHAQLV